MMPLSEIKRQNAVAAKAAAKRNRPTRQIKRVGEILACYYGDDPYSDKVIDAVRAAIRNTR